MIEEIRIRNFRHFEDVTFRPHEHTSLLCGLNGTGKSTMVELMGRLKNFLIHGAPVGSVFTENDITSWNTAQFYKDSLQFYEEKYISKNATKSFTLDIIKKYSPTIEIVTSNKNNNFLYIFAPFFIKNQNTSEVMFIESLVCNGSYIYYNIFGNVNLNETSENFKVPTNISSASIIAKSSKKTEDFLGIVSEQLFSISVNPYAIKSTYEKPEKHLAIDGNNFPAWYAWGVSKSLSKIATCFQEYKAFIPGFVEMSYDPSHTPTKLYANILLSTEKNYLLPFEALSHGQKVLCVLHTLIKIAPDNSSIFIDEFENFLSPSELVPLYSAMQDAHEQRKIQFILVSHHQKTLNWFRDCAFIMNFSKDAPCVRMEAFDAEEHGEIYDYLNELAGA